MWTCNIEQRESGIRKREYGRCTFDCEGSPVFVLGSYRPWIWKKWHLCDKENRECMHHVCVYIGQSVFWSVSMSALSPLVTVSCCSDAHSSPTRIAAGPLALGSSFAPRTYRHREQRQWGHWDNGGGNKAHVNKPLARMTVTQTLGLALLLVSVWV